MMHRPISLLSYALIMFAIALSFYGQVAYLQHLSIFSIADIARNLTYFNYAVIFLCLLNGSLAIQASKGTFLVAPILICAVILNNANVAIVGIDYSSTSTNLASLAFLLTQGLLLDPAVLKVVGKRRLQWWKVSPRMPISIPVRISTFQEAFSARSFDISASGIFITELRKVADQSTSDFSQTFKPNERVELAIFRDGHKSLTCKGRVARVGQNQGRYPSGVAVKFEGLGLRNNFQLRSFLRTSQTLES